MVFAAFFPTLRQGASRGSSGAMRRTAMNPQQQQQQGMATASAMNGGDGTMMEQEQQSQLRQQQGSLMNEDKSKTWAIDEDNDFWFYL